MARELDTAGDGFLASFEAPGQAARCAATIIESVGALGLRVRACIHTGECERVGEKLGWVAVPTLVACRARDRANLGPSREIAAGVPSAELRIVPDAVHLWNLQQPELFAKTVAEFVSSLTGTITDQAPLCGLLDRLRDLGILLVSVNSVD